MNFGAILKQLRKEHTMTQSELARRLGVDDAAIRHWENKNGQTSYENLDKISKIFNVTVGQLIGSEEL